MAMKKYLNRSQALLAAALMIITITVPLIILSSSSLRRPTTYVYFIVNLLIIALGAEAGLLSFLFTNHHHRHAEVINKPAADSVSCSINIDDPAISSSDHHEKKGLLKKSVSEKVTAVKLVSVKKCPSMPSIFFIGGSAAEEEEEKEEVINDQLFTKAETFIGNFYKQLEMQRQESWKRIHGFYYNHKAF